MKSFTVQVRANSVNLSIYAILLTIIDQANHCAYMDVRMYNAILILCGDYTVVNKYIPEISITGDQYEIITYLRITYT